MLSHNRAEGLARLDAVEPDIGVHCGLHVAMAEEQPDQLVLARPMLKNECTSGMSELVHGHSQTRRLVDALGDLAAERDLVLAACALPRKQPILVPAPQQSRPKVVDVFVNQSREVWFEWVFQSDAVLHIVVWENKPIIRAGPARLDQIDSKPDRRQVGKSH